MKIYIKLKIKCFCSNSLHFESGINCFELLKKNVLSDSLKSLNYISGTKYTQSGKHTHKYKSDKLPKIF